MASPKRSSDKRKRAPIAAASTASPAAGTDVRDARIAALEQRVAELEADEGHSPLIHLIWRGGKHARLSVPRPRFLVDVPEHSDPTEEDPGNLVIEGDNRQAMVSLLSQYAGRVDVCLTDPPYNTGKGDFRYNDARFADPDADSDEGKFVSGEDGGRHGKWLNQMAPTLRLIHSLLAKHGVLLMHINDIELPRLLLLLEEIFDQPNHLGTVVWRGATDNNPSQIAVEHEYVVVYAKDRSYVPSPWNGLANDLVKLMNDEFNRLKESTPDQETLAKEWKKWVQAHKKELPNALGRKTKVDDRGPYQPDGDLAKPEKGGYFYPVIHPVTKQPVKLPLRGWRFPTESMDDLIAEDRIVFGKDHTTVPGLKRYLQDDQADRLRSVIEMDNRTASYEIKALFADNPGVFKNPKPAALEEYLLTFVADREAIILDPFAGSGTTAHAVMRLNKRDGGQRRFILIEEGSKGDDYATTLTAERLRRAREQEKLPGGFSFQRIGDRIDTDSFTRLQRNQVVDAVLQTDASGRGGGIRRIEDAQWVIGRNARNEAICLHFDPDDNAALTSEILREMYVEAKELGLNKPLRVYGTRAEVFASDSFRFFKLPDEVSTNLVMSLRGGQ